jgi:hypothetical protein
VRRPRWKLRHLASRWKIRALASLRPIEIPVHARRIAESPQSDAHARYACLVVANRASSNERRASSDCCDANEIAKGHALLRSGEWDPRGNENYRRNGAKDSTGVARWLMSGTG